MSVQTNQSTLDHSPTVVNGELRCALSGKVIMPDEAYWAPPLVTARELIGTLATTTVRTPSNLGHILLDEQPNVPYSPEVRQELGTRRSVEQLKLLGVLLLVAAVIFAPIILLALR